MVEYLSGGRIQGSSTAEANTTVTDNLSTDTGWVSTVTGNGYDATNDRVNFKLSCPPDDSSHAGGRVYIDLQDSDWLDGSNLATNFIMRFKWRVSAMANASANENRSYMGFFSSNAWGGTAQDTFHIQFWTNTSGIQTFRLECIDNGTLQGGTETREITSLTPAVDTDYYIEMKKVGDAHTCRITTNSDYTGGTTASVTKSNVSNLRYFGFKARGDNQNNGGNNQGYIDDLKLWNNATSATKDEKETLADGTRTEANTVTLSDDFSSDNFTGHGATTSVSSNVLNFNVGSTTIDTGYRTITALSDTSWTMTFKLQITDYQAGGNTEQYTTYIGMSNTANADNNNQDFLGFAISANSANKYVLISRDGGQPASAPTPSGAQFTRQPSEETIYVKIIRDGSTLKVAHYNDSSFGTLLEEKSESISGTVSGLDNITVITHKGNTSGSPENAGKIDDLKIYDGVTDIESAVSTAPRVGTRYEETDTRKIYRWADEVTGQTLDAGTQSGTGLDTSYVVHKYISGLPAGATITAVRIDVYNMSGNLKAAVYTTTGSGSGTKPDQKLAETGAQAVSVSNTNTTKTFNLTSTCTVPSNGIVWVGWFPDGNYKFTGQTGSASYLNSKHGSGVGGASYANAMPTTAWVGTGGDGGNGGNNLKAGVVYTKPKAWKERGVTA